MNTETPAVPTSWPYARGALIVGLCIGHVDTLYRIFSPPALSNFYWQELYQALLIPSLFLFLLSLPFEACRIFFPRLNKWGSMLFSFCLLSILATLWLVIVAAGQESVYSKSGSLLFLSVLVVSLLILKPIRTLLTRTVATQNTSPWSNYRFFVFAFALWMAGYDIIEVNFLSSAKSNVESTPLLKPGAGVGLRSVYPEASALASKTPHILLITLDTVRADAFEQYLSSPAAHPYLKKIAQESLVFDRALSTAPWTLPAHASLFTGLPVHTHGANGRHQSLSSKWPTIATSFSKLDYSTLGFVGGPYCNSRYGLAEGFQHYSDRLDFIFDRHTKNTFSFIRLLRFFHSSSEVPLLNIDGEKRAEEINDEALEYLRSRKGYGAGGVFLFLNYFDAHDPYHLHLPSVPRTMQDSARAERLNRKVMSLYSHHAKRYRHTEDLSMNDIEFLKRLYTDEIQYLGHHLGEFMEEAHKLLPKPDKQLETREIITIITADHGEEFLEHGGVLHAQTLYNEVLHVPMMIHWPGRLPSQHIQETQSITLIPGLLELLRNSDFTNSDSALQQLLDKNSPGPSQKLYASRYARPEYGEVELHAMVKDNKKVITAHPERDRVSNALFDMSADWIESNNLIKRQGDTYVDMVEELERDQHMPPETRMSTSMP